MVDVCLFEGCLKNPKFSCECSDDIMLCSAHIVNHVKEEGHNIKHRISNDIKIRKIVKNDFMAHEKLTKELIQKGQNHINKILDKMLNISDGLNQRQKKILAFTCSRISKEHDKFNIDTLGDINPQFDIEEEFKEI